MERFNTEYMPETEWFDTEEEYSEFTITDASTADWAISQIADERKRTDYFIDCAKQEIAQLNQQIKDAQEKCERATQFLSGKLGEFLENGDVPSKKTKTQIAVTLPAGKIIKKLAKQEITMPDGKKVSDNKSDDNLLAAVKEIDEKYIKHKEELDWSAFKKNLTIIDGMVMTKDGEVVDCLGVTETLPSIEIKTN